MSVGIPQIDLSWVQVAMKRSRRKLDRKIACCYWNRYADHLELRFLGKDKCSLVAELRACVLDIYLGSSISQGSSASISYIAVQRLHVLPDYRTQFKRWKP